MSPFGVIATRYPSAWGTVGKVNDSEPPEDVEPDSQPAENAWVDATGEGPRPDADPVEPARLTVLPTDERRELRERLTKFLLPYKFAIDEVMTKIRILQEEFTHTGEYNPIEHSSGRLKDPESIMEKMQRRGVSHDLAEVRETITDIAGVRIVCSFVSDVYRVFELLTAQSDVTIHTVKDYIAKPKPNGYRSLHLILELPVFLSSGPVSTLVEVQIRTIAMDFWASLEHKIYYKYDREVPEDLLRGLRDAADQAGQLDASMEWLHIAIRGGDRDTLVRRSSDAMHTRISAAEALQAEVSADGENGRRDAG